MFLVHDLLKKHWQFTLICFVGLVAYSNTFSVPLFLDDSRVINPTEHLYIWNLLKAGDWQHPRIFGMLTFMINYNLHGENVLGYHVVNLSIHLVTSLLVYWLTTLLLDTPIFKGKAIRKYALPLSLTTALFFASHPIQTQAVTYIAQRLASLATLWYVLSVIGYLKAKLSAEIRPKRIWWTVSAVSFVLGMFTKEIVATVPLMIGMLELILFERKISFRFTRLLAISTALLIIFGSFIYDSTFLFLEKITPNGETVNSFSYLLTQSVVIPKYLLMLVLPLHQNLDHHIPVVYSVWHPQVWMGLVFILLLLFVAWSVRKKYPLITLGIGWIFVGLVVESSVITIEDVMFEHRLYLPMVGYCFVVAGILYEVFKKKDITTLASGVGLITIVYAGLTYSRNEVWQTQFQMWSDVVSKSPGKARGHINLAAEYQSLQEFERAIFHYEKALSIYPTKVLALSNLGTVYIVLKEFDLAQVYLYKALTLEPLYSDAYNALGVMYMQKGEYDTALDYFEKVREINPDYFALDKNLELLNSKL